MTNRNVNFNLPKHVLALVAWWREIILGTSLITVAVGATALAARALWPTYETSADVAMTNAEIDTEPQSPAHRRGIEARRAAFVGLARGGDLARTVLERLDGRLGATEVTEIALLRRIDAATVIIDTTPLWRSSNLIRITARARSPEKAAVLADSWAEEYVRHVNRLYEQVPESLLASVAAEEVRALREYRAAQEQLQTFVGTVNLDRLTRQLEAKKNAVDELEDIRRMITDRHVAHLRTNPAAAGSAASSLPGGEGDELPDPSASASLAARRIGARIDAATEDGGVVNQIIANLEDDILILNAEHETAAAARRALVQTRDAKRRALARLRNETAKLRLRRAAAEPALRLASSAATPTDPDAMPLLPLLILTAAVSLPAVAGVAFLASALNLRPFLNKRE